MWRTLLLAQWKSFFAWLPIEELSAWGWYIDLISANFTLFSPWRKTSLNIR